MMNTPEMHQLIASEYAALEDMSFKTEVILEAVVDANRKLQKYGSQKDAVVYTFYCISVVLLGGFVGCYFSKTSFVMKICLFCAQFVMIGENSHVVCATFPSFLTYILTYLLTTTHTHTHTHTHTYIYIYIYIYTHTHIYIYIYIHIYIYIYIDINTYMGYVHTFVPALPCLSLLTFSSLV